MCESGDMCTCACVRVHMCTCIISSSDLRERFCLFQQFDLHVECVLRERLVLQPGHDGVSVVAQLDVRVDDVGVGVVDERVRMPASVLEEGWSGVSSKDII